MAKLGPHLRLGPLLGAALVAAAIVTGVPGRAQDESFQDLNAIIRGLAPVEYLPEHSGRPSIDLDIRFRLGSAELTTSAMRQLDELAAALRAQALAEQRFRIAGHTDATGPAAYNLALSRRRAGAVKSYLVARHGIAAARLEIVGWGEERLKDPLNPESGVNRRVEIVALGASEGGLGKQGAAPAPDEVFALLAGEILAGLGASVPRASHIAIWPFREDEIPISPASARRFNDSFLAALFLGADGAYQPVEKGVIDRVSRHGEAYRGEGGFAILRDDEDDLNDQDGSSGRNKHEQGANSARHGLLRGAGADELAHQQR